MNDVAIFVEALSKKYSLGVGTRRHDTLRDQIMHGISRLAGRDSREHSRQKTFWALKDISFEIKRGEIVGIIGRNGAGKSTLLKILSRITSPTSGHAEIWGRVGSLLEVGTGFHPELSGRENIYLNGAILGMLKSEISRKFDEIVAFSEIEKFLDTPVKHYSSGMYVRLAFAVAAHLDPQILIVDEVLAVGDAQFQKKCLGKMEEVSKGTGRTVLFVSHNMSAITGLCSRSILLDSGEIKLIGPSAEVVREYLRPMNSAPYQQNIAEHPNRQKSYKPLLISFSMGDSDRCAYYGEPYCFRIGYSLHEPLTMFHFVIAVSSMEGMRVFTLISGYQETAIPHPLEGKGEVLCRIASLPLLPGSYRVGLRLWRHEQILDEIEDIAILNVEWITRQDENRSRWNSNLGITYVDAKWTTN